MMIMPNDPRAIRGNFNRPRTNGLINAFTDYVEMWGEPCNEYEAGCPSCEAWKLFEKSLQVPSVEEVLAVTKTNV